MNQADFSREKIRDLFETKYSEIAEFLSAPPSGIDKDQDPSIVWCCQRLKDLVGYNARDGKRMRGLAVVSSYLRIVGKNVKDDDLNLALALGWAIEIMQGSFLVADDVMDQSETRRGKPCWYKNKEVGLQAINDAMLLESCVFKILKRYCCTKLYYADLVDLFREVIMFTELGQTLDMETSEKPEVDFSYFTSERYNSIIKYKTSFYSFFLPVATALYISGTANDNALQKSKEILTEMGCFFQVQDDFIDCFGDPSITGKIGKDIESNKCTWLIVQALKSCSDEQRKSLQNNYGIADQKKKATVVRVYRDLHMEELFHRYEKETYDKLKEFIMTMDEHKVPPVVFLDMLNFIYQRKK